MDRSEVTWQKYASKAVLVGSMLKHCKDHLSIRKELRKFMKEMKEDSIRTKQELKEEDPAVRQWYIRRRSSASAPTLSLRETSVNQQESLHCKLCDAKFENPKDEYPCRVCDRVFHKDCVLLMQDLHPSHVTAIERANTSTGWSCPTCDDLSFLLTEKELQCIIETFDEEINPKGGQITFDDFIAYKKKQLGHQVTEEEQKLFDLEFRLVDTDGSGTIDWWEFLNFQAKVKISSRNQNELVDMLTEKEVLMAKMAFSQLDENDDGRISELEARRVIDEYTSRFNLPDERRHSIGETYAKHALARAMSLDVKELGSVTWNEFLHGQAQYILVTRPNMTFLGQGQLFQDKNPTKS
ncbi:PHD finger protein 24-like [Saccostrea echinata]|uniref:PHD finger protein 24-like n=1 Tax=Saccostrea echinata TaxID=191078 RepID=UPI002A827E84|nr:PHD finger protein 24-like [Saccostrea echinata]